MSEAYTDTITALREEFVEICKSVFGESLVSIIAKGSAVKGGFIPGLSDVDLHVYLKPHAFIYSDFLKLEHALKLQEGIDSLVQGHDLGGSPIQVIPINESQPPEWSGPLPGTYILLYGDCDPEAPPTASQMLKQDLDVLINPTYAYKLINSFVDKTTDQLASYVRRLQPAVNPTLYRVLSLLTGAPFTVWKMTKFDVLDALDALPNSCGQRMAALGREFYRLAGQRTRRQREPDFCRTAIRAAYRVIDTGREIGQEIESETRCVD